MSKLAEAVEWLSAELADGRVPSRALEDRAARAGFPVVTLRRAKAELGIVPQKGGFREGWFWELPGAPDFDGYDPDDEAEEYDPHGGTWAPDDPDCPAEDREAGPGEPFPFWTLIPVGMEAAAWVTELLRRADDVQGKRPERAAEYRRRAGLIAHWLIGTPEELVSRGAARLSGATMTLAADLIPAGELERR